MKERCTQVNPVYKGWKAAKDRVVALNEEPIEGIEAGNGLLDGFNEQPLQDIEAGNGLLDGFNGPLPMQQNIGAGYGPLDGFNEHPPTGPKAPGESPHPVPKRSAPGEATSQSGFKISYRFTMFYWTVYFFRMYEVVASLKMTFWGVGASFHY
jgi:hypothetical protein